MTEAKTAIEPVSQGVPKETPTRNCFAALAMALRPVLDKAQIDSLIDQIRGAGYFELGLIDQTRLIVRYLTILGNPKRVCKALFLAENDKVRSFGVRVHFEHFKDDITAELRSLKYSSALPGTWTQETSQSALKELVHLHGLKRILPLVRNWVDDNDPTVRRVVIEGLRPRGVWCKHIADLKKNPSPIKPLFKKVLDDKSDYVRKAVANSLNDISKDNPDRLCEWIAEWSNGTPSKERQWIIERSLRSLIKSHHPHAMKLMGLDTDGSVEVIWKSGTPREIEINQSIPFEFSIKNTSARPVKARLQLQMIGPSKSGRARVAKYLLANLSLEAHAQTRVTKGIKFAHKNFVPKLPGKYQLHVLCNGRPIGERAIQYKGNDLTP